MTTGLIVLVAALAVAVVVGGGRRVRDGRLRAPGPGSRVAGRVVPAAATEPSPATAAVDGPLAERATLVQFSTAFCAPCRATRQLLTLVAQQTPGVRNVEVDAESHLELVRALGITRTPTTLLLDGSGRETGRLVGVPRRDALDSVLGRTPASA